MAVKYKFDTRIGVTVTWRRRRRRRRRPDQIQNIPEISNFGDIIMNRNLRMCLHTEPPSATRSLIK